MIETPDPGPQERSARPFNTAALLGSLAELQRLEEADDAFNPHLEGPMLTAATLVEFDPRELLKAFNLSTDDEMLRRLLPYAEPKYTAEWDGESEELPSGLWRLRATDRQRVLQEADGVEMLQEARRRIPGPESISQRMADALLYGESLEIERLAIDELAALVDVRRWFAGLLPWLPDEAKLNIRLAMARLLEPLRSLVGNHFVGRTSELAMLEDYVSLLGPRELAGSKLLGYGRRALRQFRRTLIDEPPLFVSGPGGVGKSSLMAYFILSHLDSKLGTRMPFVLLDFDRAQLEPRLPRSLLIGALHQLRAQFPAHDAQMLRMADSLSNQIQSEDAVAYESHHSLQSTIVVDFARQVEELIGDDDDTTPLLWVLDTFEEPQRLGESTVGPLWELMNELQQALPRLRLVVCGRAVPTGFKWDVVKLDEFDQTSALAFLRSRLAEAGMPEAQNEHLQEQVIKVVGRTPLALRLAARLVVSHDSEFLNLSLRREHIQAILFHRVIEHIRVDPNFGQHRFFVSEEERALLEEELARLVFPGLAVRRITQGVIENVLAQPCRIQLRDPEHGSRLFWALSQQVDIVEWGGFDGHEHSLLHRTDVRRMMLRDLEQKAGASLIRSIDNAAVTYHASVTGLANCAEEIYHRLRLEQAEKTIRDRWEPGLDPYLISALEEISAPAMRLLLADLLGVSLDAEALKNAELDKWERQAVRRVSEYLRAGSPHRALDVLNERADRLPCSPLLRLHVQALLQMGMLRDASVMAYRATSEAAEAGDFASASEGALLQALSLEAIDAPGHVESCLQQAIDWARDAANKPLEMRALTAMMRLSRNRGARDDELNHMAEAIGALLTPQARRNLRRQPAVLRELLAELGSRDRRLLLLGLDVLGLDLSSVEEAHLLGAALAEVSVEAGDAAIEIFESLRIVRRENEFPDNEVWAAWLYAASPTDIGKLMRDMLKAVPTDKRLAALLAKLFQVDVSRRISRDQRARAL